MKTYYNKLIRGRNPKQTAARYMRVLVIRGSWRFPAFNRSRLLVSVKNRKTEGDDHAYDNIVKSWMKIRDGPR